MTACGAILSAMVVGLSAPSCDANSKLLPRWLVGLVKDGFRFPLHVVECGFLRRFGEKFPFQGLNRR
jgi:hypothetical protein